ncbi:MAG: hypothetical protein LKF79_08620 [Solobacterium sp.]|jgi:uncharacterized protein YfkK (UPF0435 family)|nr:hypothetical protein [Solobacterium sp.]MCH4223162.1 hypothetical protein [Solobacterium sp.]MCH4266690.1 hypothetical protein [Solobacterium sp.]
MFGKKHNPDVVNQFDQMIIQGSSETEGQFLDSMNSIVKLVENEDSFSTNDKLKIYDLFSQLSNCSPSERTRYAKKVRKLLK